MVGTNATTKKRNGCLIIFCGIPGSGKTTIASQVAAALGSAVHIQTDTIRFMIPAPSYSRAEGKFVYEAMFQLGRQALKNGYDAILDGTFLREDYRAEARRKLSRLCSASVVVCVLCDPEVARVRNSQRDAMVPEASFNRLSASFEKPKDAIFVHSDKGTVESTVNYLLRKLRGIEGWEERFGIPTPRRETA